MKKILLINTKYREYGGEDSNIIQEIDFLSKNYQVEFLEFDNSEKLKVSDIISFITRSNKNSNKILKDKLLTFKPDIVYVHNIWFKANLGIFKVLENYECKVLIKIHNFRYFCTRSFRASKHLSGEKFCYKCGFQGLFFNRYFKESFLKSFFAILFSKKYLKILKKFSFKILVLNKFHKHNLEKLGISSNKIEIFYNPLNLEFLGNTAYDPNSNYFVFAGRLTDSKGIKELVESWKLANLNDLELRIIGQGDLQTYLQDNYKNNNLKFLGPLSNTEVLQELKKAKGVITATKMQEGQPRLLNEAAILGVPCIFPRFGGMLEYFPEDYEYSFEQYNYKDLVEKIKSLSKSNDLLMTSKQLKSFTNDLLNYKILANKFEEIVQ